MFPGTELTADINTLGHDGLILLARPKDQHAGKTGDPLSWNLLKEKNNGVLCWFTMLLFFF